MLALGGIATGVAAFTAFLVGRGDSDTVAQTMAFATVVFAQLGYVYSVRGEQLFLRARANRALNAAVALSALIATAALTVPPLRDAFSTAPLSPSQLAISLGLATVPLLAGEIFKAARRAHARRARC